MPMLLRESQITVRIQRKGKAQVTIGRPTTGIGELKEEQ